MSALIGYFVFLVALLLFLRGVEHIREHYTREHLEALRRSADDLVPFSAQHHPVHGD